MQSISCEIMVYCFVFYSKEATSLRTRPIFHCTTLLFLPGTVLVFFSAHKKKKSLFLFGWVLLIASLTHHMRDGYRRGLWMCPFPASSDFTYTTYILLLITFTLCSRSVSSYLISRIVSKKRSYDKLILLV